MAATANTIIYCIFLFFETGLLKYVSKPTALYCDNTSAMQLAQNPRNHGRTKHIRVRFHRIREYIGEGEITVKHVSGLVNSADGFTKPLTGKRFAKLVQDSGLIGMNQVKNEYNRLTGTLNAFHADHNNK